MGSDQKLPLVPRTYFDLRQAVEATVLEGWHGFRRRQALGIWQDGLPIAQGVAILGHDATDDARLAN